jgi:hypothetical protein
MLIGAAVLAYAAWGYARFLRECRFAEPDSPNEGVGWMFACALFALVLGPAIDVCYWGVLWIEGNGDA